MAIGRRMAFRKKMFKRKWAYKKKAIKHFRKKKSLQKKWGIKSKRRYKPRRTNKFKTLSKKVKSLQQSNANTITKFISREYGSSRISTNDNAGDYYYTDTNFTSFLENAIINMKWFNPSAPGTLVSVDYSSGTFSKNIFVTSSTLTLTARNNCRVPALCHFWYCLLKGDTSLDPRQLIINSVSDNGNMTVNSLSLMPSDCDQLHDLWKVKKAKSMILQPGQQTSVFMKSPKFKYNPAVTDSHAQEYQMSNKPIAILMKVQGVPAHDQTNFASEIGVIGVRNVDVTFKRTIKFEYDGGANITQYFEDNNLDSFTNAGEVSNKPNQQYQTNS